MKTQSNHTSGGQSDGAKLSDENGMFVYDDAGLPLLNDAKLTSDLISPDFFSCGEHERGAPSVWATCFCAKEKAELEALDFPLLVHHVKWRGHAQRQRDHRKRQA